MRILALQPYDAASHRAFLEGWQRNSRHTFELLTLPGRHFKWRMRQAPIHFANEIQALAAQGGRYDALWCTSMLDLAALRGLSPAASSLPAAVYFHENQLAYPARHAGQRDVHFGLTNMTAALAAIASQHGGASGTPPPCVWWNSAYNRDSFLDELDALLQKMPDHQPTHATQAIRDRSVVIYPGIDPIVAKPNPPSPPINLLWAARWEYDKGPELFFDAVDVLAQRGIDIQLSVIGEQFAEYPACFNQAKARFADRIAHWGYQPTRKAYETVLQQADTVVSTSNHEFFGLAVAEAVSAGCRAVLPDALAYPEVWGDTATYHDQTPAGVANAIERAITLPGNSATSAHANRYAWSAIAPQLDDAIDALVLAS